MKLLNLIVPYGMGILAGGLLAIQSVFNASLSKNVGAIGSILVLTTLGLSILIALALGFPEAVTLRKLPSITGTNPLHLPQIN